MPFNVDYKQANANLMPEGSYEAIIRYAGLDVTKGNAPKEYIKIPMTIRNDIEQPYKNAIVWHALWRRKEPGAEDQACDGFSARQIQALSKAAGLPNGKAYASLNEWMDDLKNRPIRITVKHEEWQGKLSAKVDRSEQTRSPDCRHVWSSTSSSAPPTQTNMTAEDEDDLPF